MRNLRPPPGSAGLVLARAALFAASSLPTWLASRAALANAARRPYFTGGALDAFGLYRLGQELAPAWPALLGSLLLSLLLAPLLDAAALLILDPGRDAPHLRRALIREAPAHALPLLRITAVAAVLDAAGIPAILRALRPLGDALARHGYSATVSILGFGLLQAAAIGALVSVVGAVAVLSRAATVLDGRRRVRRTMLLSVRALPRLPLAVLVYAAVTLASQLLSGGALVLWRQADPYAGGSLLLAATGFLLALAAQAFAWLMLLRGARALWLSPRLADIRARPDGPLGILREPWFFTEEEDEKPSSEPSP